MISKDQKKQIEDLALLLEQAQGEIQSALAAGKTETALQLLEDCQNSAIFLGNQIEQTEREDFATVRYLEEYCEQIYQTYQALVQGEGENQETAFDREQDENRETASGQVPHSVAGQGTVRKTIQETALDQKVDIYLDKLDVLVQKITESIRRDIPVRREAVFLPYKASMWDSLESVWQAADADPEWDAYVIPIPYYDRRPDGQLGQLHYEGGQFPDYVPVTGYRDYDLEKRHPDIVFIHNPYDGYNRVTSVYPSFYSGKLKKYTGRLVYIPYFVLEDSDTDNPKWLDSIKHFCLSAGVVTSDQVFVQSETLKRIYVNNLTEQYGLGSRKGWQRKIYGTGSPKLDKLLCTKREDLTLPDTWLQLIHRPDGSAKKVILYNTSVASLLEEQGKMLQKIQDVFQVFRENQEEAILWWRPHPLIVSTIRSMLPHLLEEYQRITASYCAEGFGIYDDTPDMTKALMFCDAYYGDKSSLTLLARKTGKPVMLQNASLLLHDAPSQGPGNASEAPLAALRQRMLEKPYKEDRAVNLYSLLKLPGFSDSECFPCQPCGARIWDQSKAL